MRHALVGCELMLASLYKTADDRRQISDAPAPEVGGILTGIIYVCDEVV